MCFVSPLALLQEKRNELIKFGFSFSSLFWCCHLLGNPTPGSYHITTKHSTVHEKCFPVHNFPAVRIDATSTDSWHLAGQPYVLSEIKTKKSYRQLVLYECCNKNRLIFPELLLIDLILNTYLPPREVRTNTCFLSLSPDCYNVVHSLWVSLFLILSQRLEPRSYCALGCDVLRFSSMNQIILSDRWSDSNRIKESNPWIIQKDHFLFLFERSTSCSHFVKNAAFLWRLALCKLLNNPFYFISLQMCSCANRTKMTVSGDVCE